MTETKGTAKIEFLRENHRYVRFLAPFPFCSDVLGCWSEIPTGFICDLESVPLLRGTNPEAGGIHDLVCRKDFKKENGEAISKTTAAKVYKEFQEYYDSLEHESNVAESWFNAVWDWTRRGFKTGVVYVAPGYWQRFNIMATYEEITL